MIKIIFLLILCVIFYFLFKKNEYYQNLDEFYKLNELIDTGDESRKFSFTIEKINIEPVTNEFIDTSTIEDDLETGQEINKAIISQENKNITESVSNNISKSNNVNNVNNVNTVNNVNNVNNINNVNNVDTHIGVYVIKFQQNNIVLKQNGNIISESQGYMLDLNNPGEYIFECNNDFMVKSEFIINIESDNIIVDGRNILINLSNNVNKKGVFKNGTSSSKGKDNVIIKNMHFIYKQDNFSQFYSVQNPMQFYPQGQNSSNTSSTSGGGGGVCMDYFGRESKHNVISNCYVYRTNFENNSGGIIGKYAAQKNGELIVMNCVVNGSDMESAGYSYNSDSLRNIGGICGSYLGENGGKVLVYNCSNYATFSSKGSSGIVGGNAANNNSHVLLFCCSNFGNMTYKDMSAGLVGPNSCKDNSNLSLICCYSMEETYPAYSESYGSFVGYSSVLNKSNLNIVMCYNTLNIDSQDNTSKYFIGSIDSLSQSVSGSDGSSGSHTPEQQQQHARDNDSKIMLDFCFNSFVDMNISDNELKDREFGRNKPNIKVSNSGRINLYFQANNSNTFFSNRLRNYILEFDGVNNNDFPYNNIFSSHSDKLMNITNNHVMHLFTSPGRSTVNLKQYFDDNIQNERCFYSSNSSDSMYYYKLKYNLINTACANEQRGLDPIDSQYNSMFSTNVDFNLCKNKSLENCDQDKCVFKTFYESVRCFPKNTANTLRFDNPVGSGQQFINCFNLDSMQCQNNQNCYVGPGNICVNRT